MNSTKYSNLPDIDTAQDIYETEDDFLAEQKKEGEDAETGIPIRPAAGGSRFRNTEGNTEGLDVSNLMDPGEAGKKFHKAERRREHLPRLIYSYPTSSPSSPTSPSQSRSLGIRLRALQAELDSLEAELADPSNPLLRLEDQEDGSKIDTGTLMRGLVDVRGRLETVKKGKEGRGKLVGMIMEDESKGDSLEKRDEAESNTASVSKGKEAEKRDEEDDKLLADLDKRVGELEDLIGSSSIALDEASPLPAPLLPMLSKLNSQLALLTQPRHLDSISRRLKLLISDLDRLSSVQQAQANARRGQPPSGGSAVPAPPSSALQEQLLPLLARLTPHLPHLPHMLTRMRTLSSLHAAAADFQGTLTSLEDEQLRVRTRLDVLTHAVEGVEKSLEDNAKVVRSNVSGLEERVEVLMKRLDALG